MFGIGIFEIAAIALVALVFIRPKDLPKVFRKLGRWYRLASEQAALLRSAFNGPLDQFEDNTDKESDNDR